MTCLTFGAEVVARLESAAQPVEIRDEAGRTIGYFHPLGQAPRQVRTPLDREELEKRRQQRTGQPLAEVLRGLPGA